MLLYNLLLIIVIAAVSFAFSDDEYLPPAYDEYYEDTVPFRDELRKYNIPTRMLHDKRTSAEDMAKKFFCDSQRYIDQIPNDRKFRVRFVKRLAKYLAAHRSEDYKITFRRIKDKVLTAKRAKKAQEKRLSRNKTAMIGNRTMPIHPIASFNLEPSKESRELLDSMIEFELAKSGIDVTQHSPDQLAYLMQKRLRYFADIDPIDMRKVVRRIGSYIKTKMNDDYEYVWSKKLQDHKRVRCRCSTDGRIHRKQCHDDLEAYCDQIGQHGCSNDGHNVPERMADDRSWQQSEQDNIQPIQSHLTNENQIWQFQDPHHWDLDVSDYAQSSSSARLDDYSFTPFPVSPISQTNPFDASSAVPHSPGHAAYEELRDRWYNL